MHIAKLVAITEVKNVPPDIRPFVDFRADVEERKLDDSELVAILVIDTTTSYIPVFLKDPPTMEDLVNSLAAVDAEMTADTKAALAKHMKR